MRKKRKLIPVELWQLGKVESWLTEQGQNGLQLEKLTSFLATFQQVEPQQVEYRVIVTKKKDTTPTNTEELALLGWEFVTSYQFYHVFRSQTADATSEIEPDLNKQADALTGVMKQSSNLLLVNIVSVAVVVIAAAIILSDAPTPVQNLIEGVSLSIIVLLFSSCYAAFTHLRDYLGILQIKRKLKEGIALDYRALWQFSSVKKYIWHIMYFAVIAVSLFVLIKQVNSTSYDGLPADTANLPVLRLQMVESQERQLNMKSVSEEYDWNNSLSTNWSIFAPVQYETRESRDFLQENQAAYSPVLSFQVTECVEPILASALFKELANYYEIDDEIEGLGTAFDRVFVEQLYDDYVRILTLKDKRVQYVDYQGEADIETILQALENL